VYFNVFLIILDFLCHGMDGGYLGQRP
jgi:hypothetical protein